MTEKKKKTEWSGFIFITVFFLVFGLGIYRYVEGSNLVSKNYWTKAETGSDLEATYAGLGSYEVSSETVEVDGIEYMIYAPTQSGSYPVILTANGAAAPATKYEPWFERLASWGYVVIGSEQTETWDGQNLFAQLTIASDNEKADLSNVGAMGLGQGAIGIVRAVENGLELDTAYLISLIDPTLANNRGWGYDITVMDMPVFFVSGNGESDETTSPIESLIENYNQVDEAVIARCDGLDYTEMIAGADGYMTLWLNDQLKQDTTDYLEDLANNTRYTDVQYK